MKKPKAISATKSTAISKDRTKTKFSYRTLSLVKPFKELVYRLKAQQEEDSLSRFSSPKNQAQDTRFYIAAYFWYEILMIDRTGMHYPDTQQTGI